MSAPKISLKQLLLAMILVAIFLAVFALSVRGNTVALGVVISVLGLFALFAFYQVLFAVLYTVSKLSNRPPKQNDISSTKEAK